MEQVRAGRLGTLEAVARAHGQELVTFAYLLTRDPQLAQDLVQGVLTRLADRDLAEVANPVGYVKRCIVNDAGQHHRRLGRWSRLVPRLVQAEAAPPAARVEDRLLLWSAMDRIPATQRAALVLRYYEDLDDAAIAEVLGCAPATVRSHLSRGLARLRPLLSEQDHS